MTLTNATWILNVLKIQKLIQREYKKCQNIQVRSMKLKMILKKHNMIVKHYMAYPNNQLKHKQQLLILHLQLKKPQPMSPLKLNQHH